MNEEQKFSITFTQREMDEMVKHIDGKNLQARNCSLDTVRLLLTTLSGLDPQDEKTRREVIESALRDIKHHFVHNRDGIIQFFEHMMRGGSLRKFADGA